MMQSAVVQDLFKLHFGDKKIIGIEIGTKCADLTVAILSALPNCFIYTIDPWEHREGDQVPPGDEPYEAGQPQSYHDINKSHALNRLSMPEYKYRVIIIPHRSADVAERFDKESIDFVWVDGDHSKSGITKDIELYYPLIKPGGIFGGHDFLQCHPLTEIIKEKFGDKIITGDDFTWYIIK
jgi:hypothetical protein